MHDAGADAGRGALPARRRFGAPRNWRDTFIAVLGETSNVSAAARAAAISLSWVYKTRREDPDFARRWFAALSEGYDNLELELLYRLRTGLVEEVDAQGSKRKFDIATGLKILLAHRQTVSREKARDCPEDEAEILAGINAKIDQMRAREKEMTSTLAAGNGDFADDAE
ncbi:MAG: hypothetical protein RLZZ08_48 [Pseudomonadota bacterium]|jgi:hypothetical protein